MIGKRILFVGESVSLAHVARPAVLARWAREAGHEVHFACGSRYAGVARGEGLEPVEIETADAAGFYERLSRGKFFYTFEELRGYVRAELELIERVRPDLVVGDFRLTLPISAKLAGVKCLQLANAHWSPAAERNLPAPEGGIFGLLPGGLRERLFSAVRPLAYRFFAAPLDRVRRSFGLPGFKDFREHYTAGDFCAYLDLPELFPALGFGLSALGTTAVPKAEYRKPFDNAQGRESIERPKADLPPGHFFLGPVPWEPEGELPGWRRLLAREKPCAYVTMGSSGDDGITPKVVETLLSLGCEVMVTGKAELPWGLEDGVFRAPALPGAKAAALSDLVVCHGGSGTVYQALEQGVPVLCLPKNPDQRLVAGAVERAGAGMVAEPKRLREQLAGMLAGRCRQEARRLAEAIRENDSRAKWLEFLGAAVPVRAEAGCETPALIGKAGGMSRITLTGHLRTLELGLEAEDAGNPGPFTFGNGRYAIRVANDRESREKAYRLVYKLYLEKEYAQPHPSKMWLSIFDALPETVTLLVERQAEGCGLKAEGTTEAAAAPSAFGLQPSAHTVPVGALTVVADSEFGLPADRVYRGELDALRASGRRLAEIVSLGVDEKTEGSSQVLVKLFNFAYFVARGVHGATDFVITVNPRHVRFYQRLMLFEAAGPERPYGKVGGAPAVPMRLDFDLAEEQRRMAITGETESRRSIYDQFRSAAEEPESVAAVGRQLRPMSQAEIRYFLAERTDLLAQAFPEEHARLQECCLARELDPAGG